MKDHYRQDLAFVADVLSQYQMTNGHGEFTVKMQDGRVQIIKDTRHHKPESLTPSKN